MCFVAGATGFVGREVVARLAPRARVIAHVRPGSAKLATWRERFAALGAEVDTTAWEPAALAATLRACAPTHVFCLIGTTRGAARGEGVQGDPYLAIDYGLTQLLCDAAAAAGSTPRLVYLSSVGVGPRARSAYLAARWKAEEAVRGAGLPWVIARPSFIVGAGDGARRDDGRAGEKAAAVVVDGVLAVVGLIAKRTRARYRSITPEALADVLVRAGLDGAADRIIEGIHLR
ncbi:MAG: NAD(P)H-binding protein [Kofleriaceae bacterium]|nr:NAD(P)H-binding protein [Kofleriaceae bacterium]